MLTLLLPIRNWLPQVSPLLPPVCPNPICEDTYVNTCVKVISNSLHVQSVSGGSEQDELKGGAVPLGDSPHSSCSFLSVLSLHHSIFVTVFVALHCPVIMIFFPFNFD